MGKMGVVGKNYTVATKIRVVNQMAAKAFILIETVVGRTKQVASTLQQLERVKSADCVTGPYDIIAVVEGDKLNDIGLLITDKIHPTAGISRTVTCLAI